MVREKSYLECAGLTARVFCASAVEKAASSRRTPKRAATIHDSADQTAAKMYSCAAQIMTPADRPLNIICFATFFKGADFMRECKAHGCNVILVTKEKMLNEDWPRDVLDEVFALPNDAPVEL